VADPGTGDELGVLARAFNDMAADLEAVEQRRQALLADLAHELRTPLATIEGYAEGLADGVIPADAAAWEVLRTTSARLARLVDDVAAVSNAEERQHDLWIARHHPAELIHAAVEAAQPAYDAKGVRLDARIDAGLPQVAVDADRLGEVLGNLLDNAMRHTPAGGQVTVSTSRHDDEVALTVADTGEGIPQDALPHVFERFFRADPARPNGGSGIGLTIARAITHAHGGRIEISSPGPGCGTRVAVRLPSAPPTIT
jgi:signal transduction histidine kinase